MRKNKWVWALAVSLGLNLFFSGFLVSRCSRTQTVDDDRGRRAQGPLMFRVREALGDSVSDEVNELLEQHRQAVRGSRRELRRARTEARQALEAEPFEPQELRTALERLRESSVSTQETLHEGLLKLAESVSPEQRKQLADANWRKRAKPPR